jgi:hypothetical protein
MDPTAGSLGIAHLYHYETFNEDFLIATLHEQKIHCSTPGALNDPWDCQPYFDYRPMAANPAKLEANIVALREIQTPELRADPRLAELERMLRTDPDFLQHYMEDLSRHMREEVARHRIYCLTTIPDSTLMWSHYARNHTGICLEFAVDNPLFRLARPVRYRTTYPEFAPARHEALELVLTKSKDWIYENEFRLVSSSLDGALKVSGDYFLLPPGALVGVIIGCQAQDPERIARVIGEHASHLRVKIAVREDHHYKLHIIG